MDTFGFKNQITMTSAATTVPEELAAREARFALFKRISLPIWVFDIDRRRVHWANTAALQIWKSPSLEEMCSRDMGADMSATVAMRLKQYQRDFINNDASFNEQWTIYPGGVPVAMNMQLSGIRLDNASMGMLCESRVIEPDKPESLRSVEALLHTAVMISLYDAPQGEALYRNPAARESVTELNRRMDERVQDKEAWSALMRTVHAAGEGTLTLPVHTTKGLRWHEISVRQCRDAATGRDALLVSEVDVSAIKQAQAHSNYLAKHDSLTGLPNRSHVIQRFEETIKTIQTDHWGAALIYLDLDHFKDINDTLGHAAGDDLLIQVARRLRSITRSTDMVARLGGDEFLILIVSQDIHSEITQVRDRMINTVAQPLTIQGTEVLVTPSVGVSIYPDHGTDMDTLMRNADLAMYCAKESGRNAMTLYEQRMTEQVQRRMTIETDLRHALERQEFEVYYQPRIAVQTGKIVGAEALVRWHHPTRGLLLPTEFIPICERTGMVVALGDWVFEAAALQQKEWAHAGFDLMVSINLSSKQFRDPDLLKRITRIVERTGGTPQWLEMELTESMLLGEDERTYEILAGFEHMGFSISVDDFGTGYSNLAYLHRFPIHALKIDRAFVQGLEANRSVAELIVAMCRLMKLQIVAEGVETSAQLQWVVSQGIEQYQGYLYAEAMPAQDFTHLLSARVQSP